MARGYTRKMIMAIVVLGVLVTNFVSTINLHYYASTTEQKVSDEVDTFIRNRTSSITPNSGVPTRVDSEELVDLQNIPPFMTDYFEWHGRQLQQMKKDAKFAGKNGNNREESYAYLRNYRFLVLRCAASKSNDGGKTIEDRCGGLSDRLKPFPLFIWYAATTNRILFIRWGKDRPAPIQTFMVPGEVWNWTFPDVLMRKIEKLEESASVNKNQSENFSRLYFEGLTNQHRQMLNKIGDHSVWMVEANDFTGGRARYEDFVNTAIKTASAPNPDIDMFLASKLRPRDALYETFYHDLFHATFRPSAGVQSLLDAYFYVPQDKVSSESRSWLPVPLQRNQYAVAQFRASYPKEPYRVTQNRTILRETSIHAVECAKSRVGGSKLSNIYVTSDTGELI